MASLGGPQNTAPASNRYLSFSSTNMLAVKLREGLSLHKKEPVMCRVCPKGSLEFRTLCQGCHALHSADETAGLHHDWVVCASHSL